MPEEAWLSVCGGFFRFGRVEDCSSVGEEVLEVLEVLLLGNINCSRDQMKAEC